MNTYQIIFCVLLVVLLNAFTYKLQDWYGCDELKIAITAGTILVNLFIFISIGIEFYKWLGQL